MRIFEAVDTHGQVDSPINEGVTLIVCKRARKLTVGVGLLPKRRGHLFCSANGIRARDEPAGRLFLVGYLNQRPSKFSRIAGLPTVLAFPKFHLLRPSLVVVLDGPLCEICGLLGENTVTARLAELQPVIDAQLEETVKEIAQAVEDEVLTSMGRVVSLSIRRRKMLDVIDARAVYPDHQWAPGGNTGMIITGEKAVGKKIIKTHEFDATISRELRETEKQIAIELKQWSEKVKHKFDPMEWLRTASVEELRAALPALRAERERLGLPAPPKLKPN
jgi:hypothetical protein